MKDKLKSIIGMKCPQCLEADFFISHPYDLKNAGKTPLNCPNCNLDFRQEPGYYFGALYVSYGLGVGLFVGIYFAFALFVKDFNVWWPISIIAIVSILTGPYLYALSKIIWINMFIKTKKLT
jgi:hypothetical protein